MATWSPIGRHMMATARRAAELEGPHPTQSVLKTKATRNASGSSYQSSRPSVARLTGYARTSQMSTRPRTRTILRLSREEAPTSSPSAQTARYPQLTATLEALAVKLMTERVTMVKKMALP